jgi:CRISPR/Cas system-associated protein Cas5 (RAMP superfamily)
MMMNPFHVIAIVTKWVLVLFFGSNVKDERRRRRRRSRIRRRRRRRRRASQVRTSSYSSFAKT